MKLSEPKVVTFTIALILGVLGILGMLVAIPFVSTYALWFLVIGFVLLVLGNLVNGL